MSDQDQLLCFDQDSCFSMVGLTKKWEKQEELLSRTVIFGTVSSA